MCLFFRQIFKRMKNIDKFFMAYQDIENIRVL